MVIGGGISGILSALLLSESFNEVFLIEKQSDIGGLLNSYYIDKGISFDYGTHVIAEIGVPKLDDILLDYIIHDEENWSKITPVRSGNFFRGQMNNEGPCIDSRFLCKEDYEKGLREFLTAWPEDKAHNNLREQLCSVYGETFARNIFEPSLQKLFGTNMDEKYG